MVQSTERFNTSLLFIQAKLDLHLFLTSESLWHVAAIFWQPHPIARSVAWIEHTKSIPAVPGNRFTEPSF